MEAKHTKHEPNPNFSYVFPAIRGVQAGREYYVSMCPLRLLPKLFQFDDEEMLPELRAQRTLNRGRIPDIARYIVVNKSTYTSTRGPLPHACRRVPSRSTTPRSRR